MLAFLGLFGTAVGLGYQSDVASLLPWNRSDGSTLARATPVRLAIPSLGVRADVVEVGRAADGSIATPTEDPAGSTGWFALGPSPGEAGTSIIVGHVDTSSRPAVFHTLSRARGGKLVEVNRRDGTVVTFRVDSVEKHAKTAFPASRIFGPTDRPRLALVTCGGTWVGGDVGYADNVIVFATLV